MSNITYLFFGFASEYVLHPLYKHMQAQGHRCIELDLFNHPNPYDTLKSLKGTPVVFVNCAHLFFDYLNFKTSYQYDGAIISALEIIDYLKPVQSFYIPHDLSQLFHEKEIPWLNLFDYLLIPRPKPAYLSFHPQVINTGWIKRNKHTSPVTPAISRSIGFAFCDFEYHRRLGAAQTYLNWKSILDTQIPVKLPYWQETDLFENFFKEQGIPIFPSTSELSHFIDEHGIIICNSTSSVNTEAAFAGRHVINVLYKGYTKQGQIQALGHLPNINYLTIDECAALIEDIKTEKINLEPPSPPLIKPFDFDYVSKLLTLDLVP